MEVGDLVIRTGFRLHRPKNELAIITKVHWSYDDEEGSFEVIACISGEVMEWFEYELEVINGSR